MKNKIILIAIILCFGLVVASFYFKNSIFLKSKPTIHLTDNSIYIGNKPSGLESPSDGRIGYREAVKALNKGWEYIRLGNSYDTAGQYQEAVEAYKKAYIVDPGDRVLIGDLLIKAYEKISRYDEAIAVVDEILKTERLGKRGIDDFTAIRFRLLAAKAQSSQT